MSLPTKIVLSGTEARDRLIKGANFGAECVRSSLGPFGANALIEKGQRVTNDGVTIAREIQLSDEIENLGWSRLRETAIKANDEAGDGTTTATLLAQEILKVCTEQLSGGGTAVGKKRPIEIINQLEKERKEVIEKLEKMVKPIKTLKELTDSARVSVGDEELAKLIAEAQWKIGKEGVLTVEETPERICSIEYVDGIQIDNGFSISLAINNQEKQSLDISDCHVIITSHIVSDLTPLFPIFDHLVAKNKQQVAIFARAWTSEGIRHCQAHIQKGFAVYPLNAPYTDMKEIMQDMASVLGANYIDDESRTLSQVSQYDLGIASKIVAMRYKANIVGKDTGNVKERVTARIKDLEKALKGSLSEFEKKSLQKRIAQLKNGQAIIKIGSTSETERKYKHDKAEDGVNAVRAAWQEGTVPGGGLAFLEISDSLPESYLLKRPLAALNHQIMSTAPKGFEIEEYVRDPFKILRVALEKAISVAGTLASATIAIATERPKSIDQLLKKSTDEPEQHD